MPIPFTCPHCESHTLVDDEYAGQTGPCHACNYLITVPYPSTASRNENSARASSENSATSGNSAAGTTSPGTATASRPTHGVSGEQTVRKLNTERDGGRTLIAVLIGVLALVFVGLFGLAVYWLGPGLGSQYANDAAGEANLKRIYLALEEYHDMHGAYPPAYIADANGKPMHSWRVLILPQLGYDSLYEQYDFRVPYNEGSNVWLGRNMPTEYAAVSEDAALAEANYFVVVGKHTMFPGVKQFQRGDLMDPRNLSIMVVEAPSNGAGWMEPSDPTVAEYVETVMTEPAPHRGGFQILCADGHVDMIGNNTPREFIEAQVNNGDSFNPE